MNFILRPWRREDVEDVLRYANNDKIARNLRDAFPHPYTLTDAEYFVNSCLEAAQNRQLFRAIEIDGHAVGSISCAWAVMCTPGPRSWATGWRRSTGAGAS